MEQVIEWWPALAIISAIVSAAIVTSYWFTRDQEDLAHWESAISSQMGYIPEDYELENFKMVACEIENYRKVANETFINSFEYEKPTLIPRAREVESRLCGDEERVIVTMYVGSNDDPVAEVHIVGDAIREIEIMENDGFNFFKEEDVTIN